MSTKQQTNQSQTDTRAFDPQSMQRYQTGQDAALAGWQGFAGNPLSSPWFANQMGMMSRQANQLGQTGMQNFLMNQNQLLSKGTNTGALYASEAARQGRATGGLQAQGTSNLLQNALGVQQNALAHLGGFAPLQTGGTSVGQTTNTTSGLGTWLPQLAGSALGMAGAAMGGRAKPVSSQVSPFGTGFQGNTFFHQPAPYMPSQISSSNPFL